MYKISLIRLQRNGYIASCALGHFACNEWKFSNTNSLTLISSISPDDSDMFSFDYSDCDITKYYRNVVIGCKKFLLHEDTNRMDVARAHAKRVYLFVKMAKSMFFIGVLWIIYKWTCCYTL